VYYLYLINSKLSILYLFNVIKIFIAYISHLELLEY